MGYGAWLDEQLPAHRAYGDVIEERLRDAKAVLVIWSADAARSEWVRSEANRGRADGKLVQMALERLQLPMPFDMLECADLVGWDGAEDAPGWRKVVASIAELTGPRPTALATGAPVEPEGPLLAVLAFDNFSGDPEMNWFSDGVSEEILQTVARSSDLRVIGRTSSFQYRGADKVVRRMAAELKATHILDGSVRRNGPRVRISTHLMECANGTTLWSERFDRDLSDIFELQDEIARAVAASLKVVLSRISEPHRIDPAAYELYLRARSLVGAPLTASKGLDLLGAVVRLAPDFAPAWSSLAIARASSGIGLTDPVEIAGRRVGVTEACERALALNPDSGLAHVALSTLEPPGAYARRAALLEKARAAEPSDGVTLKYCSDFFYCVGQIEKSFEAVQLARQTDPLSAPVALAYAERLGDTGRVEEFYAAAKAGRDQWPDYIWFLTAPMMAAAGRADWDQYEAMAREAEARGVTVPPHVLQLADLLRAPPEAAHHFALGSAERQLEASGALDLLALCLTYRVGLHDETFDLLARASFDRLFDPDGLQADARFMTGILFGCGITELRRDPRFVDLCAKLGLCDYWVSSGEWPDCVSETAPFYDFKGRATALVAQSASRPLGHVEP